MSYLLRREDDYKLCYSEPKKPYVIDHTGSYWCAKEYAEMCKNEKCEEIYWLMDSNNFPINRWADVSENNLGITVSIDIAEYLLQGRSLDVNEFIELTAVPYDDLN